MIARFTVDLAFKPSLKKKLIAVPPLKLIQAAVRFLAPHDLSLSVIDPSPSPTDHPLLLTSVEPKEGATMIAKAHAQSVKSDDAPHQ